MFKDQDLGVREIGVDYDHLDTLWAPIYAELDHACLNDIPGLKNPASEVISGNDEQSRQLYEIVRAHSHNIERLLLLSATPVLRNKPGFLRISIC